MVDPGISKIAEWIYYDLLPGIGSFFQEIYAQTIFASMSTEEIQILCIKIALEALLLAGLLKIGRRNAKKASKRHTANKAPRKKKFKGKMWSPTGWYWDEEKNAWIPPDYMSEESQRRWTWDEKKRIWIDNDQTPKP